MPLFLPFMFLLAIGWLVGGIYLAKYFAQKYKGQPWSNRTINTEYIYGNSLNNDRSAGVHSGGYGVGSGHGGFNQGYGRQAVGLGQFGQGRVKGM